MKKTLIELLAELLEGLQVPCSLNILGAGQQPYSEIRDKIKVIEWLDTNKIHIALEKALREEMK